VNLENVQFVGLYCIRNCVIECKNMTVVEEGVTDISVESYFVVNMQFVRNKPKYKNKLSPCLIIEPQVSML
jgi:hypothetical protein